MTSFARVRWRIGAALGSHKKVRPVVPVTTGKAATGSLCKSRRDGVPLTHSPRKEVVSGSVTRRGAHKRGFWATCRGSLGLDFLGRQPRVVREPLKT